MIEITAFLGNPGRQYRNTRHNLGWLCLENIVSFKNLSWKSKFKGEWAVLPGRDRRIIILKPGTFMNKSGESIGAAASFFKVKPDGIMVIHDDIEIPFGTWQVKKGGGMAGHNGLRSIYTALGKKDFLRLRLGVGRPERGSVSSHVLGRFSPEEEAELDLVYEETEKILSALINREPEDLAREQLSGKFAFFRQ